ncbi:unnamed protein product, partial [Lampetra planeri]
YQVATFIPPMETLHQLNRKLRKLPMSLSEDVADVMAQQGAAELLAQALTSLSDKDSPVPDANFRLIYYTVGILMRYTDKSPALSRAVGQCGTTKHLLDIVKHQPLWERSKTEPRPAFPRARFVFPCGSLEVTVVAIDGSSSTEACGPSRQFSSFASRVLGTRRRTFPATSAVRAWLAGAAWSARVNLRDDVVRMSPERRGGEIARRRGESGVRRGAWQRGRANTATVPSRCRKAASVRAGARRPVLNPPGGPAGTDGCGAAAAVAVGSGRRGAKAPRAIHSLLVYTGSLLGNLSREAENRACFRQSNAVPVMQELLKKDDAEVRLAALQVIALVLEESDCDPLGETSKHLSPHEPTAQPAHAPRTDRSPAGLDTRPSLAHRSSPLHSFS